MNCMISPLKYSWFSGVFLNDQGNCNSSAPSLSPLTRGASDCLKVFSSLRLALRSWVKRFHSLALNLKLGLNSILATQAFTTSGRGGE